MPSKPDPPPFGAADEAALVACSLDTVAFAQRAWPAAAARLARLDLNDPTVNGFTAAALKGFLEVRARARGEQKLA
jgi:hypothetical protein